MKFSRENRFDLFKYLRIPRFLEMPAIGIDISDSAIRFVELMKDGSRFIPQRCGEKKIAPGIVVSGSVIKKDELTKVLASIAKEEGYRYVKASITETKAYVFNTSIPDVPELNIEDRKSTRLNSSH